MRSLRAIGLFLALVAFTPALTTCAQSRLDSAKSLFDAGRYTEAQSILQTESSKSAQFAPLYYWLSRCAFELYNNDAAVTYAERAVALDYNNSTYHYFLGVASGHKAEHANWFSALGLARKTHLEFEEAVRLDPGNMEAQRDLISYYIVAPSIVGGGEDRAEENIAKLSAINPVQAHLAKIELNQARKKWTQAEAEGKAVLASKPREVKPYLEVAEYYEAREDATGIRTAITAIPQGLPVDVHVDYYRGVADVLAGDRIQEAEAMLKGYLSKEPPRREDHSPLSSAHSWLGRLYEKLGRKREAGAEYRTALDMDSKNKAARDGLRRTGN